MSDYSTTYHRDAGVKLSAKWRQISAERCYTDPCPDEACAGGVQWTEARRRSGRIEVRTVWSNAGKWFGGRPVEVDADAVIDAAPSTL